MRRVQVQVDRTQIERIIAIGREEGASSPVALPAHSSGEATRAVVIADLPNDRVGGFVERVDAELNHVEFTILPEGILALRTPISELREHLLDVSRRSTLELVLDALQSIGSWKGLLLYSVFSGLIATYGVIFDAIYLLVAAMLIAPMGAPAMVAVIGTATGDLHMVGRGALRFAVAILVLIASAVGLGYAYGLDVPSATMQELTRLSGWIALLAVIGGAAGAQSQVLSDRNSLVTATATGFLIAVALSPTSAVLGLSLVLGDAWSVRAMAFVLILTFVGIVSGGAMLLRIYGVRPGAPSPHPRSGRLRTIAAGAAVAATAGLVIWQTTADPSLRTADRAREAAAIARQATAAIPHVQVLEVSARFARAERDPLGPLVVSVVVAAPGARDREAVDSLVANAVARGVAERMSGLIPYVQVTVAR